MLDHKTPLWFLDETFGYFILQRSLEDISEKDIQLTTVGRSLCLKVDKLNIDERFQLPRSIDLRGMNWVLNEGMLTLTLEKAPLGRAIRVNIEGEKAGQLYGQYNFDHMFPPGSPIEAFMEEDEEDSAS